MGESRANPLVKIKWDCLSQVQFKDMEATKDQTLHPSAAPPPHRQPLFFGSEAPLRFEEHKGP